MIKQNLIKKFVLAALHEDHFRRDITSQNLISAQHKSQAVILVKDDGIICGLSFMRETFRCVDHTLRFTSKYHDGMSVKKGSVVATIQGKTRSLLTAERTALNFLSYLSGIATQTSYYVKAIKPNKAKILDTRKTTPTMRDLEKYAVKCGGGENHRFNLEDMVLIKDNHLSASHTHMSIGEVVRLFKNKTKTPIEIEVDNLNQFEEALKFSPDYILLDNMKPPQLKKAVQMLKRSKYKTKPLLEASGGITLNNVRQIAQTGVDRISIGALTHQHRGLNVSMEIL